MREFYGRKTKTTKIELGFCFRNVYPVDRRFVDDDGDRKNKIKTLGADRSINGL